MDNSADNLWCNESDQHDAEAVRPRVSTDNGTTFGPMLC
jgi:hypothetical protein